MQAARGASLNSSDPEATPRTGTPGQPRLWTTFALVASTLYAIDVTTKIIAVERLSDRGTVEILGSWFGLHLTRNPGAAFSTGTSYTVLLSLLSIVASVLVLHFSRKLGSRWWAFGLGALLAGILGNLTDRIFRQPGPFRGHVIDFLQLPNWPIFNIADICINVAAGVIILQAVRGIGVDGTRHERTSR
jgi:signal peptidase II